MTWTFVDTNVPLLPRDQVRLEIGDTNPADPQFQDEVITWLLDELNDSVIYVAIRLVRNLIAKYSRMVDKTTGDASARASQRVTNYKELLSDLLARAEGAGTIPAEVYSGGISYSDKDLRASDGDRIPTHSRIGQFDVPGENADAIPVGQRATL